MSLEMKLARPFKLALILLFLSSVFEGFDLYVDMIPARLVQSSAKVCCDSAPASKHKNNKIKANLKGLASFISRLISFISKLKQLRVHAKKSVYHCLFEYKEFKAVEGLTISDLIGLVRIMPKRLIFWQFGYVNFSRNSRAAPCDCFVRAVSVFDSDRLKIDDAVKACA